tara:strand:- start:281 stop:457 length:177 start_codon:yes stop_codon:yes gene_type:complete
MPKKRIHPLNSWKMLSTKFKRKGAYPIIDAKLRKTMKAIYDFSPFGAIDRIKKRDKKK